MRKSVIITVALAFLLYFTGIPSAEESGTIEDPARGGESHKGDKGISFSVSGLSSIGIGQVEGGGGAKFWISNKLAMITSIGVSAQRQTMTNPYPNYTDAKSTFSRFSIFVGVEDHFFIKNKISPYLGGGTRFTTSPSTVHPSIPIDNPPPSATKKEKRSTKTFGIRGFCGIEYFFADWVSLAGQYQIDYFYEKSTRKRTLVGGEGVTQPKEEKSTRTTLGLGTSALVATFYIW
jgi:hypothetical protein